MTVFIHFHGCINYIFAKIALKFQHFNKNPHNIHFLRRPQAALTPLTGRVFETPDLNHVYIEGHF